MSGAVEIKIGIGEICLAETRRSSDLQFVTRRRSSDADVAGGVNPHALDSRAVVASEELERCGNRSGRYGTIDSEANAPAAYV